MKTKRPGKLGRYAKILSFSSSIVAIIAAILSSMAGFFAIRLLRFLSAAERALPTLEQAAKVYLEQNPPVNAPTPKAKGKKS